MKTYYSYCYKGSHFWEYEEKFYIYDRRSTESLIATVVDAYSNLHKDVDIIELIVEDNLTIISTKKVDDNIVKKILMLL